MIFSSKLTPCLVRRSEFLLKRNVHKTMGKPFTIVVEGNIGCGKTTFINHFKNNNNILCITEPVDQWKDVYGYNLLNLMYKDLNKWGFAFQSYVQLTMTKLHETKTTRPVKMLERSIFSARYCFVENLKEAGVFSPAEVVVLDEWFKWITERESMTCDLIVYLRCSPEVAYERVRTRNRAEEVCVSKDLLVNLHKCHDDWLYFNKKFSCPAPVLVLDADKSTDKIEEEYNIFKEEVNFKLKNIC